MGISDDQLQAFDVIDQQHVLAGAAVQLGPDGLGDVEIPAHRIEGETVLAIHIDHALHLAGIAVEDAGAVLAVAAIDEHPVRLRPGRECRRWALPPGEWSPRRWARFSGSARQCRWSGLGRATPARPRQSCIAKRQILADTIIARIPLCAVRPFWQSFGRDGRQSQRETGRLPRAHTKAAGQHSTRRPLARPRISAIPSARPASSPGHSRHYRPSRYSRRSSGPCRSRCCGDVRA